MEVVVKVDGGKAVSASYGWALVCACACPCLSGCLSIRVCALQQYNIVIDNTSIKHFQYSIPINALPVDRSKRVLLHGDKVANILKLLQTTEKNYNMKHYKQL